MASLPVGSPCDLSEPDDLEDDLDSYLSVGEASASEVVYVREHVCVWPSRGQRIPGRLSLVKQHCVLFMTWLPYGTGILREDGSFQVDAQSGAPAGGTARDSTLYAIHPLPLSEVRLLRAHTPTLGAHRLDVTLISGLTLPPLHLPAQAIHSLLQVIKQHVALVPSATTRGTWLVNEVADPLVRSLSALDLGDVLLGGPPRGGAQLTWAPPAPPPAAIPPPATLATTWASWVATETVWDVYSVEQGTGVLTAKGLPNNGTGGPPPVLAGLGRAAWRALSTGLSRLVTEYSGPGPRHWGEGGEPPREGAGEGGEEGAGREGEGGAGKADGCVSWQRADGLGSGGGSASAAAAACLAVGTLAHCHSPPGPKASPTTSSSPSSSQPSSSRQQHQQQQQQLQQSADPAAPAGASSPPSASSPSTQQQQQQPSPKQKGATPNLNVACSGDAAPGPLSASSGTSGDDEYEMVERNIQTLRDSHLHAPTEPPLSEEDLTAMMDAEGRLSGLGRLRERCWQSGLEHGARRAAWPLLLGLRAAHHTAHDHRNAVAARRKAYGELCQQWAARIRDNAPNKDMDWWESCSRIDKDVCRTDRAHPMFSAEGCAASKALRRVLVSYVTQQGARDYCQGMSDLAAPLLVVLADESEAFAAFCSLMKRMGSNFDPDQQGMHAQLAALRRLVQLVDPPLYAHLEGADCLSFFFCFRWLLINFKREFKYEEVLRLWEALWCAPSSPQMHLFLAAAVLVHHRKAIMTQVHDFDAMLKFCIQLSGKLELPPLLRLAQALATYVGTAADDLLTNLPAIGFKQGTQGAVCA